MTWNKISKKEFEKRELDYIYQSTTGVEYFERKKYRLYWDSARGGLWVRTQYDRN